MNSEKNQLNDEPRISPARFPPNPRDPPLPSLSPPSGERLGGNRACLNQGSPFGRKEDKTNSEKKDSGRK